METLLIPLYGRMRMTRAGVCDDPYAERTVAAIDYDFAKLKIAGKVQVLMAVRSRIFDDLVRRWLAENPGGEVLSLGSGLDARHLRQTGYARWTDLDFPEVIRLREALLPPAPHHGSIASSATEWAWLTAYRPAADRLLVVMEGLSMYLHPEDVYTLLSRLAGLCGQVTFMLDAYSTLTARKAGLQPSLRRTGAVIRWGVDDPAEIERRTPLRHSGTVYLTDERYTATLGRFYKAGFRLAARFAAAREAHRVLIFRAEGAAGPAPGASGGADGAKSPPLG